MSRVRFQLLFGPASTHPYRMSRPEHDDADPTERRWSGNGVQDWYGWRLMGANNRELGRSARSFASYPLARRAVMHLQQHADQLVRSTEVDPATGRWRWRLDLDNTAVAISGRWYERDHDSRLGMAKFVTLVSEAELTDGVVTMPERRNGTS
jgi:hypothetical protein